MITSAITRSITSSITRGITDGGSSGTNMPVGLQWALDNTGYADDTVGGLPVLQSKLYPDAASDPYPINVQVPVFSTASAAAYVDLGTPFGLFSGGPQPFTFCAWVYFDGTGPVRIVATKDNRSLMFSIGGNERLYVAWYQGANDRVSVYGGTDLVANTWYHVAGAFLGGSVTEANLKLWVNGVEETYNSASDGTASSFPSSDLTIGRWNGANAGNARIADVAIYDAVQSIGNIQLCMNGNPPTTNLVGYYRTQEGSGSTIYNSVENDNHGTITGTLTNVWDNRSVVTKDHCVEYGGRLESGAFIPSLLSGASAANGANNFLGPNQVSPNARIDRDPTDAAGLSGYDMDTPFVSTDDVTNDFTPNDSMWRRVGPYGEVDRIYTADTSEALTASELAWMKYYSETGFKRWTGTKIGSVIAPTASKLAFYPQILDVTELSEWPCDYIMTHSTDHGSGGIYLNVCTGNPSVQANWKTYTQAVTDGDFDHVTTKPTANPIYDPDDEVMGFSCETACSRYISGTWYCTTHQINMPGAVGSQTTTMSKGAGQTGLLNLAPVSSPIALDYDPDVDVGDGHTGYFEWGLNPFPDLPYTYFGWSLHGGTTRYKTGQWGTNDLEQAWTRIAVLERHEADLIGGPDDWQTSARIQDLPSLDGNLALVAASEKLAGGVVKEGRIFQVELDRDGKEVASQIVQVIDSGGTGDFDEEGILGGFSSVLHEGQRYMFYMGVNSSDENAIGVAAITAQPQLQSLPKLAPRRDDYTDRLFRDFTVDQSLPSWLIDDSEGTATVTFGANGMILTGNSSDWSRVRLNTTLIPQNVGRIAVRLYGTRGEGNRIPSVAIFRSDGTQVTSTEKVTLSTSGSLSGDARLRSTAGGSTDQEVVTDQEWGYGEDAVGLFRDIGFDWHADANLAHFVVGENWAVYDQITDITTDTAGQFYIGVMSFNDVLSIKKIEILYGRS